MFEPDKVTLSRLTGSSMLGVARLGQVRLGQTNDTRERVDVSELSISDGYGTDDETGVLVPEASTGQASLSVRMEGTPVRVPLPLAEGDRVEASYDGVVIARQFHVVRAEAISVREWGNDGYDYTRVFVYTLRDAFYMLLGRKVSWTSLPAESALTRVQRFGITISYSHMTSAHQTYLLGVMVPAVDEEGSSTLLEQLRQFCLATKLPVKPLTPRATDFLSYEIVENAVAWPDQPLLPNPDIGDAVDWSNEYAEADGKGTGSQVEAVSVVGGDLRFLGGQRVYPDGSGTPLGQLRLGYDQLGTQRIIKVGFTPPDVVSVIDTPTVVARVIQEFGNHPEEYTTSIEVAPAVTIDLSLPDVDWGGPVAIATSAHSGFPGLTVRADGSLYAVWRRGTNHSGVYDGDIYASVSTDRGTTWLPQFRIVDGAANVDLRDPSITRLTSGTLVLSYFEDYTAGANNTFTVRSSNSGASWSSRTLVTAGSASSPPVELALSTAPVAPTPTQGIELGQFILGEHQLGDPVAQPPLTTAGRLLQATYGGANNNARVFYSDDEGQSWSPLSYIVNGLLPDGGNPTEPWLVRDPATGTLIATIRSNGSGQMAFRSVSTNNGATWSAPVSMGFASDSRIQTLIVNGVLHAYYRGYADYFNLYHRESTDLGVTWSTPDLVDSHTKRNTYAAPVDLGQGVIGLAYSYETWDGANPNVSLPNYSQLWFTRRND